MNQRHDTYKSYIPDGNADGAAVFFFFFFFGNVHPGDHER
jgi:hypothetical protein